MKLEITEVSGSDVLPDQGLSCRTQITIAPDSPKGALARNTQLLMDIYLVPIFFQARKWTRTISLLPRLTSRRQSQNSICRCSWYLAWTVYSQCAHGV